MLEPDTEEVLLVKKSLRQTLAPFIRSSQQLSPEDNFKA